MCKTVFDAHLSKLTRTKCFNIYFMRFEPCSIAIQPYSYFTPVNEYALNQNFYDI